ncbi:hypothetical protein [Leucobacter sp. NPDC077196]|uniref:hypothetical protein n=1 Tax=Leucobacter sp. NPDC077196 TaxID=3154959 RepID=UPI003412B254
MAFNDPPYATENTDHSARLFRRQFQQSMGEGSGVSRPSDLKVSALNVPGNGFRVAPGGGVAQSRDTATSARESYGPVNEEEIVVTGVPGTGSGQTRRDLVIVEITDPQMQSVSYPEPTDPEFTGAWLEGSTFCRITVIPGVASSVRSLDEITTGPFANVTGITLAAINWLPSTSTIGPGASPTPGLASIEDLREVHSPQEKTVVRAFDISGAAAQPLTSTGVYPDGATWPLFAEATGEISVEIPAWATQVAWVNTVAGIAVPGGGVAQGWLWMQMGANADPDVRRSNPIRWDVDASASRHRVTLVTADTLAIPSGMRGKTVKFYPRGNKSAGSNTHTMIADNGTAVAMTLVFREVKE